MSQESMAQRMDHPLYEQRHEQRLHHVRDRVEMIAECVSHGDRMKSDAAGLALDALNAEASGDYVCAELLRGCSFHQNWYAEKWHALSLWMTPNAELGRVAPREEECAKAMAEVWSPANNAQCIGEYDELLLRRAEDVRNLALASVTYPPGKRTKAVADRFPLPAEERWKTDAVDRMPAVVVLEPGEDAPIFDPISGVWRIRVHGGEPVRPLLDELELHIPFADKPIEIGLTPVVDPDRIARIFRESVAAASSAACDEKPTNPTR